MKLIINIRPLYEKGEVHIPRPQLEWELTADTDVMCAAVHELANLAGDCDVVLIVEPDYETGAPYGIPGTEQGKKPFEQYQDPMDRH